MYKYCQSVGYISFDYSFCWGHHSKAVSQLSVYLLKHQRDKLAQYVTGIALPLLYLLTCFCMLLSTFSVLTPHKCQSCCRHTPRKTFLLLSQYSNMVLVKSQHCCPFTLAASSSRARMMTASFFLSSPISTKKTSYVLHSQRRTILHAHFAPIAPRPPPREYEPGWC